MFSKVFLKIYFLEEHVYLQFSTIRRRITAEYITFIFTPFVVFVESITEKLTFSVLRQSVVDFILEKRAQNNNNRRWSHIPVVFTTLRHITVRK